MVWVVLQISQQVLAKVGVDDPKGGDQGAPKTDELVVVLVDGQPGHRLGAVLGPLV